MGSNLAMVQPRSGDWEQQEMHRENQRRMDKAEASIERNQEILIRIDENTKGITAFIKDHEQRLVALEKKWAWAAGAVAAVGAVFEYLFHYIFHQGK